MVAEKKRKRQRKLRKWRLPRGGKEVIVLAGGYREKIGAPCKSFQFPCPAPWPGLAVKNWAIVFRGRSCLGRKRRES